MFNITIGFYSEFHFKYKRKSEKVISMFFIPVRFRASRFNGKSHFVPEKGVRFTERQLYTCPLYRDTYESLTGKHSVPWPTVRLTEVSALWCVRFIEIPLYNGGQVVILIYYSIN